MLYTSGITFIVTEDAIGHSFPISHPHFLSVSHFFSRDSVCCDSGSLYWAMYWNRNVGYSAYVSTKKVSHVTPLVLSTTLTYSSI